MGGSENQAFTNNFSSLSPLKDQRDMFFLAVLYHMVYVLVH